MMNGCPIICPVVSVMHILDGQTVVNKGELANELTVRYATKRADKYLFGHSLSIKAYVC